MYSPISNAGLPRSMVFIDHPNILMGAKSLGIQRLRYEVLVAELTKDTSLVGSTLYAGDVPQASGFYTDLERRGIRVERVAPSKSVDGRLILDMLASAFRNEYDVAMLASGDRDYQRLVEEVKRLGKQVWVCSFEGSISPALRSVANRFVSLNTMLDRIGLKSE